MSQDTLSADEAARVRRGADAATQPDVLRELAADPSVTVRAALALNPHAPPAANEALAHDQDERVRVLLARKLASLLPSLAGDAQARLQRQTLATLTGLVADEAMRVRAAVAEVVKDMPRAPRELILTLTQDPAVMVSEPVIRFSPVLGTQDLLSLLAIAPSPATLRAVAERANIEEPVSDVIAATTDSEAIRALLCNRSAQIRESMLDALIARAVRHVEWHEPLVNRPVLPPRAARALSEIVATHLLEALAARTDLDPALGEELRTKLAVRMTAPSEPPARVERTTEHAMVEARAMDSAGRLTEAVVLEAARQGETRLAAALLAVAAGVPIAVVDRAAALRSAKGLVSLAWKAGFSMHVAGALETLLARLAPGAVLPPGPGGSFPLAVEEMRWQLDFLGRIGR
jgi:uncharacterized protein (DUF2336 family)